ncbi:tetratricopeptide repeat protein [Crocinitomix catalasitica]|nr:tetratricopeptide repeat protein [Crocinitomix catalasitica]
MRILFVISLFLPFVSFGQLTQEQENQIDSLKRVIKKAKHDSIIINAWIAWDNIIYFSDPGLDLKLNEKIDSLCSFKLTSSLSKKKKNFFLKNKAFALNNFGIIYRNQGNYASAIDYHTQSLTIKEEIGDKKGIAKALSNIGIAYYHQGDYSNAIDYHTRSFTIYKEIGDKSGIAVSLGNIGLIHYEHGDHASAIDYHTRSLTIYEEIGEKRGIAMAVNNIGLIYDDQGDDSNAIDYYNRGLTINEEIGDNQGIAMSLNNIGNIYQKQGDYTSAIDCHTRSLTIKEEIGNKQGIGYSLANIGALYTAQGDDASAIDYYNRSLIVREEIGDEKGMAASLNNIGLFYLNQGEALSKPPQKKALFRKAISFSSRALSISQEIGDASGTMDAAEILYTSYKAMGEHQIALEMHELYVTMRDSILSEENQNEVIRQEYKYEYDKQALTDSVTHAKESQIKDVMLEKKQAQLKSEQTQRYALYGGLGLVGCLAFVLLRGFQRKKKDNVVISLQKEEVELHRKNILDSINYAERIQQSILPMDKEIKKFLPGFSSLYLPKDIVSGDFYWFTNLNGSSYLALSDCTGHGVPGAFMSMMGSTLLRDIIIGSKIEDPAEILERLDDAVRELLGQDDEDASEDGMETALVKIDHQHNKIVFSGANQHLYLIRDEVEIVKADLRSIGGWVKHRSRLPEFTNKEFDLNQVRTFYLSSDGLEDQFSGNGQSEKFGRSRFVELISDKGHAINLDDLESEFIEWKGDADQIDDVCVIRVKV